MIDSCAGCHGRAGDGADPNINTVGFDAGLRQHHWQAGVTVCANCHSDANPNTFATVGENILPPNYANPGAGAPDVPDDPCDAGSSPEDKVGSLRGLDNDGDGFYDGADPDCGATAATPGEALDVTVSAHDSSTQLLTLSYISGCGSTGNKIVLGPMQDVGTHGYTDETCAIGNTGSFGWTYPASPDSFFFLLVTDNGIAESSYGTRSDGTERPKKTGGCWLPQDLTRRCDL